MVGWLVKCDFITPSGTSDPGLDSESKFEQSVAKVPNFFVPPQDNFEFGKKWTVRLGL